MLGEGLLNKQIAYKLSVSEATIKAHVSAILQKLGVDSRTQAVIAISKIGGGAETGRACRINVFPTWAGALVIPGLACTRTCSECARDPSIRRPSEQVRGQASAG